MLLSSSLIGCSHSRRSNPSLLLNTVSSPTNHDSKIVGLIGKTTVRRDDLWIALLELGGEEIIEDYVLTLSLEQVLNSRGLKIVPEDIEYEYQLLRSLTTQSDEIAFENMLQKKGIGHSRKSTLLWRNAALRKLVQDNIEVHDDAVRRMFAILHGDVYPTRIIVLSTLQEANEAIQKLEDGSIFSDIAIEYSIDSSASRGGRVEPISPSDPSWPSPIRETISSIEIDLISNPILIGDRWVILKVTGEPISSGILFEDVESEMNRLAVLTQERFYMEELVHELMRKQTLKIIDPDVQRALGTNQNHSK